MFPKNFSRFQTPLAEQSTLNALSLQKELERMAVTSPLSSSSLVAELRGEFRSPDTGVSPPHLLPCEVLS